MQFTFAHYNINVIDIDRSVEFYDKALGFEVCGGHKSADGSFELVFMKNENSSFYLELTWLADHPEPYNLGENEMHLAVHTDNYDEAHKLHKEMGCIVYENEGMGLYFIVDPDGYWIEIIPPRG